MNKAKSAAGRELSYYGLSLQSYLLDSHPDRASDNEFIDSRADSAAELYSQAIRGGLTHPQAEEIASAHLYEGLHFSPYNTIVNILWDEFSGQVPETEARAVALRILTMVEGLLSKYELTDDFADSEHYDTLYNELVGTIQTLLENGLQ